MAHLPVNHPAQPLYRLLSAGIALYILVFGVASIVVTWGRPVFDRGDTWVLGLQTNPAFGILSTVAGLVLLGGGAYGRNVDHFINLWGGVAFLLAGIFMLLLLRTEANLFNFAVVNVAVSFLIGVLLLLAGLYGKVGPRELQESEDRLRHGQAGTTRPGTAPGERAADVEARTDVPTGADAAQDGTDPPAR
jgi:hypothetical protein